MTKTKLVKNLLLDIAEDAEVAGNSDNSDNETVKRSPFSKKPNGSIGYLTSLGSRKNMSFP